MRKLAPKVFKNIRRKYTSNNFNDKKWSSKQLGMGFEINLEKQNKNWRKTVKKNQTAAREPPTIEKAFIQDKPQSNLKLELNIFTTCFFGPPPVSVSA